MSVPSYPFPSLLLKLPNKGMDFLFPSLKLLNKEREKYYKMIIFIHFHSILFPPPKQSLNFAVRDENGVGRGGAGRVRRIRSLPRPVKFCLTPFLPRLASQDWKNFLTPSSPHPLKLYFLLIYPQLLQFFLIKPVLLIKIYLKLQINLSHKIKLIFSKN